MRGSPCVSLLVSTMMATLPSLSVFADQSYRGRSSDTEWKRRLSSESLVDKEELHWSDFQVSLENTAECGKVFQDDDEQLREIASVMARKWLTDNPKPLKTEEETETEATETSRRLSSDGDDHGDDNDDDDDDEKWETPTDEEIRQAEESWLEALEACHGPLPHDREDLMAELTATKWMSNLRLCGDRDFFYSDADELCLYGWCDRLEHGFENHTLSIIVDDFITSARCAFHLEYPLIPQPQASEQLPPIREQRPGWRPQRVILIALTMGGRGPSGGCKLVETGYPRGWELILAEGRFEGIKHKFTYALKTMDIAIAMSSVPADDTLVIFADSFDVLVQQRPDYVIDQFLNQPFPFIWSGEHGCFPVRQWPNSFGIPAWTCDTIFPSPPESEPALIYEPRFVNAGGWLGMAPAARRMLVELNRRVRNTGRDEFCYDRGTDQLLSNASLLRYRDRIGLDLPSIFFADNPRDRMGNRLQLGKTAQSKFPAWCFDAPDDASFDPCPALLHFNGGGGDDDEQIREALEGLRIPQDGGDGDGDGDDNENKAECLRGEVTIINLDRREFFPFVHREGLEHAPKDWPCGERPKDCN